MPFVYHKRQKGSEKEDSVYFSLFWIFHFRVALYHFARSANSVLQCILLIRKTHLFDIRSKGFWDLLCRSFPDLSLSSWQAVKAIVSESSVALPPLAFSLPRGHLAFQWLCDIPNPVTFPFEQIQRNELWFQVFFFLRTCFENSSNQISLMRFLDSCGLFPGNFRLPDIVTRRRSKPHTLSRFGIIVARKIPRRLYFRCCTLVIRFLRSSSLRKR